GLFLDRVSDSRRLVDGDKPPDDDHAVDEGVRCSAARENVSEDQTRIPRVYATHERVPANAAKAIEPRLQPAKGAHILAPDGLFGRDENDPKTTDWQSGLDFGV